MAKTENKTSPTGASVGVFIDGIEMPTRKRDAETMLALMKRLTGLEPQMWGDSIVGFGRYHYRYDSGREGDFFLTGFSPRKSALTVYIVPGFDKYADQLARLGPHKHSVSCLYLNNLERNDLGALEEMIVDSVEQMKQRYDWWKN